VLPVGTGNDQRFFRPSQRLNINLATQVVAQTVDGRRSLIQRMGNSKA
jgi:hypothetical protein